MDCREGGAEEEEEEVERRKAAWRQGVTLVHVSAHHKRIFVGYSWWSMLF